VVSLHQLTGDEPSYLAIARGLRSTHDFIGVERAPGYPVFLAVALKLTGGNLPRVLDLQALLGATTVPLTYALARSVTGRGAALLAAFGVATSYALIHHCARFESEVLFTPSVILVALALTRALRGPTPVTLALAGLTIGASVLIHATLLLFPVVAIALLVFVTRPRPSLRQALPGAAALALGAAVLLIPWTAHVDHRFGAFKVASGNAVIWQGSPEYADALDRYGYAGVWSRVLESPAGRRHPIETLDGDQWWTDRGVRSIKARPAAFAWFSTRKAGELWVGDPHLDWNETRVFNIGALHRAVGTWPATLQITLGRLLILFALAAAWVLRRRWRDFAALWSIVVYTTAVAAVTASVARLGEPLYPLLYVTIAAGLAAALVPARRLHDLREHATTGRRMQERDP
jgi:4-amino-4-deoxy-L-arabinose transferase-like glycosyltransferase